MSDKQDFRNRAYAKATMAKELRFSATLKVNKNANENSTRLALFGGWSLGRFIKSDEFLTKLALRKPYIEIFCVYNLTLFLLKSQKLFSQVSPVIHRRTLVLMWRCQHK
ncbi:hypothetical protein SDJN03_09462, partial [Cucurbita argyrosperma subsp. sororia]